MISQFKVLDSRDGVSKLLFDTNNAEECGRFARANGLKRIALNPYHGYQASSLDPILPLTDFIEDLIVGDDNLDLSSIGLFAGLKYLGLPNMKKSVVDLRSFPNLKTLAFTQSNRVKGFESCTRLEFLTVSNLGTSSLVEIHEMPNLTELTLFSPALESLDGIQKYSRLKKLEISSARKLRFIGALSGIQSSLVELEIAKTKGIEDIQTLAELHKLRKLILSDSGEIQSLSFMNGFEDIDLVSFWGTTVLDGDMTLCGKAKRVGFNDKRHYNRKEADFKERSGTELGRHAT